MTSPRPSLRPITTSNGIGTGHGSPDLPAIPSLPPIDIDSDTLIPHDSLSARHISSIPSPLAFSASNPPSSSHQSGTGDQFSPTSHHSVSPTSSLRKSFSVDSLVSPRRSPPMSSSTRYGRSNPPGAYPDESRQPYTPSSRPSTPPHRDNTHPSQRERDPRFPLSSRSRGASVSTTADDFNSHLGASDDEGLIIPDGRLRRSSVKAKDGKPRQLISSGDLNLPSRLPTHPSTSDPSSRDVPAPMQAPSAVMPKWNSQFAPSTSQQGRSRSGSLGVSGNTRGIRSVTPNVVSAEFVADVNIGVIGETGCGKSAAIAKGLKGYSLSEPVRVDSPLLNYENYGYTLREGKLVHEYLPDRVFRVLEVETSVLKLDQSSSSHAPVWPEGAPRLDGAVICYDITRDASFTHVEHLIKGFREMKLPVVVFACKRDLQNNVAVASQQVYRRLSDMDVGLIETSVTEDSGKNQLRLAFDWMLQAVSRARRANGAIEHGYQNPASPGFLASPPPWDVSRSAAATPTAASPGTSTGPTSAISPHTTTTATAGGTYAAKSQPLPQIPPSSNGLPRSSAAPTSPARARSTSDLLSSDHEKSKSREHQHHQLEREQQRNKSVGLNIAIVDNNNNASSGSLQLGAGASAGPSSMTNDVLSSVDEAVEERVEPRERDNRPVPWATLDELLDKLLFLAVSGDDRDFISHFLLTYRRFASPRSVVLAMQKRMRQLDQSSNDPMFSCFAQMRICHLLEMWIQDYPHDFAVGAAAGALNALVKSIISKTHLLHYGSDFLPFLESRPLVDKDSAWALKVAESPDESDGDSDYMLDDEEEGGAGGVAGELESPAEMDSSPLSGASGAGFNGKGGSGSSGALQSGAGGASGTNNARERKSSLPLTAKVLLMPNSMVPGSPHAGYPEGGAEVLSAKQTIKELLRISQELSFMDPNDVAQEITRIATKMFLQIEPRHWLQHTFVTGKKEPETDPIARFSEVSNHLADWVLSLILCHDKPKARSRQIEKLVEIAQRLRHYNNYSGLRAFVAGINNATYQGDPTMEIFQQKAPALWKSLQSWDLLLQSIRSHRAYRMALRNTKRPCIPALEVHVSDLIRAHEGNPDSHPTDPSKIHWAKFNMIGKFIHTTTQYQIQCRSSDEYSFTERPEVRDLLMRECVMDPELQRSRITPPSDTDDLDEVSKPHLPRTMSRDYPGVTREGPLIKKLMFWGS